MQAGLNNQENLLVVDNPYYIEKYNAEFEKLWTNFATNTVEAKQHQAASTIQNAYRNKKGYNNSNRKY